VISDDMEMGALQGLDAEPEVATRAVNAGCDLLIYGRMLRPEVDAAAVAEGLLTGVAPGRLREAQERIDRLREGCR